MEFDDLQAQVTNNPEFRKLFIASPRETLLSEGFVIPEGVQIEVIEEESNELVICIPQFEGLAADPVGETAQVRAANADEVSEVLATEDIRDYVDLQRCSAKNWELRQQLIDDPYSVLAALGLNLPDGCTVRTVESTADRWHIAIPPPLQEDVEIDEELLATTVAGMQKTMDFHTAWTISTTLSIANKTDKS